MMSPSCSCAAGCAIAPEMHTVDNSAAMKTRMMLRMKFLLSILFIPLFALTV
jgi:hypothetical protein